MKAQKTRVCPICGNPIMQKIRPDFNVCRFCGRSFQPEEIVRDKIKGRKRNG